MSRVEQLHRLRSMGLIVGTRFRLTSDDSHSRLTAEVVSKTTDRYQVEFDSGWPEFRKVGSATLTSEEVTALARGR